MKTAVILLAAVGMAFGHSWLACADYRGDVSGLAGDYDIDECMAFGRDWSSNLFAGTRDDDFGADRGYNYQPGGGATCRTREDADSYNDRYPRAVYVAGSEVRLVWPAKNHGSVRDFGLSIFGCCGSDCTDDLESSIGNFASDEFLIAEFPPNVNGGDLGFGRCPDESNSDRAVCFQDITIPTDFEGDCTFVWYWPFNSAQDIYTSCFDAEVLAEGTPLTARPTTEPPTNAPDEDGNDGDVTGDTCGPDEQDRGVGTFAQCGGSTLGQSRRCCLDANDVCFDFNPFYAQCVPRQQVGLRETDDGQTSDDSGIPGSVFGLSIGAAVFVTALAGYGMHKRSSSSRSSSKATSEPMHVAL